MLSSASGVCACAKRPDFAPIEDDEVMRWLAVDIGEWEEIRQCPECGATWLAVWPEENESPPVLCRPKPQGSRKLRDLDHAATMRPYCLARLEEQLGEIKERNASCRKVNCSRHRLAGTTYCIEHLIAERFGKDLAQLGDSAEAQVPRK
jgi:hypothetical protein